MDALLAVDVGLRTGLALYGRDGRLVWYRSHHFGTPSHLRRAVRGWLDAWPQLSCIVLEGGGHLVEIWKREAAKHHVPVRQISAEAWRRQFLHPRQQRNRTRAKDQAIKLARRIIVWSNARRPTSLRDDAAEAILVGLWGALEVGWLTQLPEVVQRDLGRAHNLS